MQSNNRVSKVSRLIQKELSNVFNIDLSNQFSGIIISVTTVRITPDFSEARVFLSVFPLEKPNEFIKVINDNKQFIRGKLGSRIKNQFRKVPKLIFFLDDSAEFSNEIEELIKK